MFEPPHCCQLGAVNENGMSIELPVLTTMRISAILEHCGRLKSSIEYSSTGLQAMCFTTSLFVFSVEHLCGLPNDAHIANFDLEKYSEGYGKISNEI